MYDLYASLTESNESVRFLEFALRETDALAMRVGIPRAPDLARC